MRVVSDGSLALDHSFDGTSEPPPASADDVLRSLLELSGLCLAGLDVDLTVVEASPEFVALFGRSRERLLGNGFVSLLHPGVRSTMSGHFERLLQGRRQRFSEHFAGVGLRHEAFIGDLTCVSVRDHNGDLTGFTVVVNPDQRGRAGVTVAPAKRILSDMDARVLEGVAAGESTLRLSSRLFMSRQGVEYHVGTMLKKLKAPNRAALVSRAYSLGLLDLACWPPQVSPDFVK